MEFLKLQSTLFFESLGNQFRMCEVHCTLSIKQFLLLEYNSSIQTVGTLGTRKMWSYNLLHQCVRFCLLTVSEFNVFKQNVFVFCLSEFLLSEDLEFLNSNFVSYALSMFSCKQ